MYQVKFEYDKQFAILDYEVRFNIYEDGNLITGLDNILCNRGVISSIDESSYSYKLRITSLLDEIPPNYLEVINLIYNDQVLNCINTLELCYLPILNDLKFNLLISESLYYEWYPGYIEFNNFNPELLSGEGNHLIGLNSGLSLCDIIFSIQGNDSVVLSYSIGTEIKSMK